MKFWGKKKKVNKELKELDQMTVPSTEEIKEKIVSNIGNQDKLIDYVNQIIQSQLNLNLEFTKALASQAVALETLNERLAQLEDKFKIKEFFYGDATNKKEVTDG